MSFYNILLAKKLSGGGGITPTGTKEITENGTYDVTEFASADVNVQSGGGGDAKLVIGEFIAQDTEGSQEIAIPYSGDSYIEFLAIVPADGYNSSATDVYDIARRNQILEYVLYKEKPNVAPVYANNSSKDTANFLVLRKNSDTNAQALVGEKSSSMNMLVYSNSSVILNGDDIVRIRAKDKISVYVNNRSSYGLIASAKYKYIAVYH